MNNNNIFNDEINNLVNDNLLKKILKTANDIKDNYNEMINKESFRDFLETSKNQIDKFKSNLRVDYTDLEVTSLYVAFTLHMILE
jgi:hypothetical protein